MHSHHYEFGSFAQLLKTPYSIEKLNLLYGVTEAQCRKVINIIHNHGIPVNLYDAKEEAKLMTSHLEFNHLLQSIVMSRQYFRISMLFLNVSIDVDDRKRFVIYNKSDKPYFVLVATTRTHLTM